jgi:7-cyano-7-deazaguanine synthase
MSCAILASSGIESSVLIHESLKKGESVSPLFVACGYYWEKDEIKALKKWLKALATRRLQSLKIIEAPVTPLYKKPLWAINGKKTPNEKSTFDAVFLEGRNLHLMTQAAIYCSQHKIENLLLGALKTNPFKDGHKKYFSLLQQIINQSVAHPPKIKTPFSTKTKLQVIRRGKELPLHLTFSCLSAVKEKHCGRCNKCAERILGFREAGVEDKTQYATTGIKYPSSSHGWRYSQ